MHACHNHPPADADANLLLGDPKVAIRTMFVPIMIALVVVELNVFVDNIWCSSLGVDAVSAVTVVATIYCFFSHTSAGLGIGINVAVSNCIGAGDRKGAEQRCVQLVIAVTLVSLLLIPVFYLYMDPMIDAIGGQSIKDLCREYLVPLFLMSPFILMFEIVSGMLRGEGAAKKSTILNIVAALTNVILDPVFIFGFGMGVAGASVATGLSCVAAVVIGLWFFVSGKTFLKLSFKGFRFNSKQLGDVLYVGIPQVLEQNVGSVANLLLVIFIIGCGGSLGLTLYNLPWKVVHLVMVPACALSAAMIPVVSSARGQKDPEKMRTAYAYTLRSVTLMGVLMSVLVVVAADAMMYLFSYGGDMAQQHDELVRVMWIYAPFITFYGLISFGSSLLSALKKSSISAITVLVRNVLFLSIIYICCQHTMDWVYWGVTVSEIIGGVMMTIIAVIEFKRRYRAMHCPLHYPQ